MVLCIETIAIEVEEGERTMGLIEKLIVGFFVLLVVGVTFIFESTTTHS